MARIVCSIVYCLIITAIIIFCSACIFDVKVEDGVDANGDAFDEVDASNNDDATPLNSLSIIGAADTVVVERDASPLVEYELECNPQGCEESLRCRVRDDNDGVWSSWRDCSNSFAVFSDDIQEGSHTVQAQLMNTATDQILAEAESTTIILFDFDAYIESLVADSTTYFSYPDLGEFDIACTRPDCEITTCEWADGLNPTPDCSLDEPTPIKIPNGVEARELKFQACATSDLGDGIENCRDHFYKFNFSEPVWQKVVAGHDHTCGILDDLSLWCWGSDQYGELGVNQGSGFDFPTEPIPGRWLEIASGQHHLCAINDGHELNCWGLNTSQQADTGQSDSPVETPIPVDDRKWEAVAAGAFHSCAIKKDGVALYCWGDGDSVVGDGEKNSSGLRKVSMPAEANVWKHIAVGSSHSCATAESDDGDAIYCWGYQSYGALGSGVPQIESAYTPVPVELPVDSSDNELEITVLSARSDGHVCALAAVDGSPPRAHCWGANSAGQLGNGESSPAANTPEPQEVDPPEGHSAPSRFTSISTGWRHSCGIHNDEDLFCWGETAGGLLGTGTEEAAVEPSPVKVDFSQFPDDASSIASTSAGTTHSCAISASGNLYCWGNSDFGKLGSSEVSTAFSPQPVHWQFSP